MTPQMTPQAGAIWTIRARSSGCHLGFIWGVKVKNTISTPSLHFRCQKYVGKVTLEVNSATFGGLVAFVQTVVPSRRNTNFEGWMGGIHADLLHFL